ncbi:hypothetical protein D9M68_940640 [compost metagenome]
MPVPAAATAPPISVRLAAVSTVFTSRVPMRRLGISRASAAWCSRWNTLVCPSRMPDWNRRKSCCIRFSASSLRRTTRSRRRSISWPNWLRPMLSHTSPSFHWSVARRSAIASSMALPASCTASSMSWNSVARS